MNREETLNVMVHIKAKKPNYFNNFTNEQKVKLVDEWTDCLSEYPFTSVYEFVDEYIKQFNKVPYPKEIIENIKKDDWKQFVRQEGNYLLYGESLINFIGFRCWSDVIDYSELEIKGLKLKYDPRMNTQEEEEERQYWIKKAMEIKEMLRKKQDEK